jgi:hypothetical protein
MASVQPIRRFLGLARGGEVRLGEGLEDRESRLGIRSMIRAWIVGKIKIRPFHRVVRRAPLVERNSSTDGKSRGGRSELGMSGG